jgi:hypothetical protein
MPLNDDEISDLVPHSLEFSESLTENNDFDLESYPLRERSLGERLQDFFYRRLELNQNDEQDLFSDNSASDTIIDVSPISFNSETESTELTHNNSETDTFDNDNLNEEDHFFENLAPNGPEEVGLNAPINMFFVPVVMNGANLLARFFFWREAEDANRMILEALRRQNILQVIALWVQMDKPGAGVVQQSGRVLFKVVRAPFVFAFRRVFRRSGAVDEAYAQAIELWPKLTLAFKSCESLFQSCTLIAGVFQILFVTVLFINWFYSLYRSKIGRPFKKPLYRFSFSSQLVTFVFPIIPFRESYEVRIRLNFFTLTLSFLFLACFFVGFQLSFFGLVLLQNGLLFSVFNNPKLKSWTAQLILQANWATPDFLKTLVTSWQHFEMPEIPE